MDDTISTITAALKDSPFGKLAPEIRNRIYELTLTGSCPFFIEWREDSSSHTTHGYKWVGRPSLRAREHHASPTALVQICRQIRQEATRMFYSVNTFTVDCNVYGHGLVDGQSLICDFFDAIGEDNAKAIKSLVVDVGVLDSELFKRDAKDRVVSTIVSAQWIAKDIGLRRASVNVTFEDPYKLDCAATFDIDVRDIMLSFERILQALLVDIRNLELSGSGSWFLREVASHLRTLRSSSAEAKARLRRHVALLQ